MNVSRSTGVIVAVVVVAAAGWAGWRCWLAPDEPVVQALAARARALGGGAEAPRLRELLDTLRLNFRVTRGDAAEWSGVFWGMSFAAIAASAAAGLVLKIESFKLEDPVRKDVAALLAFLATVLAGVSTTGDFQRKWQANRVAAAKVERLANTLLGQTRPDIEDAYRQLADIEFERSDTIAGGKSAAPPTAARPSEPARAASD